MSSQVLRVERFSTGTVDIHPQHAYRGRSPMYWWILASKRWLTARPINVYAVEHSDVPGRAWRQLEFSRLADTALQPFTHGHDLFGDGSLVILPTPGHTPGSVSMFVRRPGSVPLLLVGDLTYDIHALEEGAHGGVGSHRRLRQTREKVLTLKSNHPGMRILAAHDPNAAGLLDTANAVETGR